MKTLLQRFLGIVMLAVTIVFTACEPEFLQREEDIDPDGIDFYSSPYKVIIKSKKCSKILLASGSDGSMIYQDGAKVMELGHWLMFDDPDIIGDEGEDIDTLFATFNPPSAALSVEWEVADPSVLEIVSESVERGYIVVKAKKYGKTKITARCENEVVVINSAVQKLYVSEMRGVDFTKKENASLADGGYLTENYTIFMNSQNPNSSRLSQYVYMAFGSKPDIKEQENAHIDPEIVWTTDNGGIIELKPERQWHPNYLAEIERNKLIVRAEPEKIEEFDTIPQQYRLLYGCTVRPLAVGEAKVTATCQYRTVEIFFTVRENQVITPIDSLQITDNNTGAIINELWLRRGESSIARVTCFPDNAYIDYNGYTWHTSDPAVAQLQASGPDSDKSIVGVAKGQATITAQLGDKTKSFDVHVVNSVSSFMITAPDDNRSVSVNGTLALQAHIEDESAATEFGSNVRWYSRRNRQMNPGGTDGRYLSVNELTGVVTAGTEPTVGGYNGSDTVYAEITYPMFSGHPTDTRTVRRVSNPLIIQVMRVSTNITYSPTDLTYSDWGEGRTIAPAFTDGNGATLGDDSGYDLTLEDTNGNQEWATTPGVYTIVAGEFAYYGNVSATFNTGTITVTTGSTPGTFVYTFDLSSDSGDTLQGTSAEITPMQ